MRRRYDHVQRGWLHLFFHGTSLGLAAGAWWVADLLPSLVMAVIALLLFLLGMTFHSLRVADDGDALALRFGPIPMMRKRVAYTDIEAVERDRTKFVDGWGVHVVPGRGWTWNIWGWDCARLTVRGKTLRIGSDDVDGLVAFLQERLEAA